jgi:hypothetical protein
MTQGAPVATEEERMGSEDRRVREVAAISEAMSAGTAGAADMEEATEETRGDKMITVGLMLAAALRDLHIPLIDAERG